MWQIRLIFDRVENIVGKGKNAGYREFLFSVNVFNGIFLRVIESRDWAEMA